MVNPHPRCCSTTTPAELKDPDHLAGVFKALGDPTRLKLAAAIAGSSNGELCICDLVEVAGLAQSTVSHHMKQLVDAGLATREQRGKWAYYRINPKTLTQAGTVLATIAARSPTTQTGQ
ncbi:MAG: metalloregulator ArsR/SmtB family transcription factor [Bifidobacteriaceae bacterium]|jgi:ArsR family transcriptional regulator|nr:metalloregulator ArsR/SmtB family transcription factor [Bifidobacteriaceae bacterium]